jgi:hypothetical protein
MREFKIIGNTENDPEIATVKGEFIILEGFEDFKFFIHKIVKRWLRHWDGTPAKIKEAPFKFVISEFTTGRQVSKGWTKTVTKENALARIHDEGGKKTLKQKIKWRIKQNGVLNQED